MAKHFVILTGNSGTGKTRISITVAKSLEQKVKTVQTNLAGYLRQYINKEINGVRVHSVSEHSVEVYNTKDKLICFSLGIIQEYIDYYIKNGITSNPERDNMQSHGNYDGQSYSWDTTHIEKIAKFMVDIVNQGPSYQEITNMLLVPVGADWTDNTKILGFYNPISHEYQSTRILDFIITARQNENIPFFLILDEMNLSHVERYFSDFLSAMESGEEIPLYKPDEQTKGNIPPCIVLPKNLFVTGTVNIDETTYMFSPKVLDRANVIEFKPEMDDVLNLLDSASKFPIAGDSLLTPEGFLKLANDIPVADPVSYNSVDFTSAKKILETFYIKLEGSGFEFAYRTVKEIRNYIIASYKLNSTTFNLNTVLDEQLLQKILPKIHGNTRQIKNLLIDLEKLCIEKDTEWEFKDGDNQTEKVTGTGWDFELSRNKIHQMRRMLDSLNFASFI